MVSAGMAHADGCEKLRITRQGSALPMLRAARSTGENKFAWLPVRTRCRSSPSIQ
jgi:hypothetical protein